MGSEQRLQINQEGPEQGPSDRLGSEPQVDNRLQQRVRIGFAVALVLTGLLGLAGWRNAEKAADDADWVAHTHEVMAVLEATNGHLADMEGGARAFAMSGQDSFLETYEEGKRSLGEDVENLRRLTADNPIQQQRIKELRPQVEARIEAAEALVATRKTKTSPAAPAGNRREKTVEAARATIELMEGEEKQLLEQRTRRTSDARRLTSLVFTMSSLVGMVFLAFAGVSVSQQVGISIKARAQVDALNAELERLVTQRTAALGEAKGQLATVIQSAMDAIITFDDQQRIVLFNEASEKMFGCPASEALGQHIEGFIPQRAGENAVASRTTGKTGAISARKADGTQFPAEASISQVDAKDKKLITVILRDIIERRQAEEALHNQAEELSRQADELTRSQEEVLLLNAELEHRVTERTAELAATNKELEAFTYSVSHDLRAPLRHISGFTKILVEDFGSSLPAEAQRHLQRIEQGAHRMGLLVDELLNLTRVGRQSLAMQVTGLASIVKDIRSTLAPEMEGRQIEWRIGELPFVECDPTLIRQVFQNLLTNALKYSRPRSPAVIEIGKIEKDGQIVIFVKDNGVGFSMKYADKLFGVFQRLHRAEDFEGTGVGLATVHRIIQKHGGQVWAEAELDKGATFYFTLGGSKHLPTDATAVAVAGGQT